jgi:hypothetical protein
VSISIDCDEWLADLHDDPTCTCEACERWYAGADERALTHEAQSLGGGLFPVAHTLLGAGWLGLDGKGGKMPEPIPLQHLAQRAIGDVFEQLERIGSMGRDKCRPSGSYYTPASALPADQQLKRHEALELIRCAENALDYARLHLDYLAIDAAAPRALRPGDRVIVADEEECTSWLGTVEEEQVCGEVLVKADDGTEHHVHPRDLREYAV